LFELPPGAQLCLITGHKNVILGVSERGVHTIHTSAIRQIRGTDESVEDGVKRKLSLTSDSPYHQLKFKINPKNPFK
ncbi:MAG: hypothetical protein JXA00_05365, partial [Candidatus Thermoplasmatota archaeon]|nr:hypothetical protein [Candidatus Thermoplasmatota archaeon]